MIMEDELDDIFEEKVIEEKTPIVDPPVEDDILDDTLFPEKEDDNEPSLDVVEDLLALKGIKDGKVKIIDEEDNEQEVSFNELSKEEQLEILKPEEKEPSMDLSEKELQFINNLREGDITIEEYLDKYKEDISQDLQTNISDSYEIDAYDDQELFLIDLKAKYDLTDEELSAELEKELKNEDLFKKKTDKIRVEYKDLEDTYKEDQKKLVEDKKTKEYGDFKNSMIDVAVKNNDFYGVELEDDEKEDVLGSLLNLDDKGASEFEKAISSPEKLYEAAWFMKYGKEAFQAITGAYEEEINKLKKDKPQVVVQKKDSDRIKSIHEI
jgi:hypothetical protein